MKHLSSVGVAVGVAVCLGTTQGASQTPSGSDRVLQAIWNEGMGSSQLYPLAQALLDSIGPRLTGSPGQMAAQEWAMAKYRSWGPCPFSASRYTSP
ncbi:MAG TPA: hypothetical protein VHG28_04695 [Longimicrobiaceae bacterium]|nr:hypothetical protein [Longimicrobiaceae bacterium]